MSGHLLVMGGADHGNDHAQQNAQGQRHGGYQQGRAHTVQILLPTVGLQEGLIEFHIKILPEAQLLTGDQQRLPLRV